MNINKQICEIIAEKYLKSKKVVVLNFEAIHQEKEEKTRLVVTISYKAQKRNLYFLLLSKNEAQNIFLEGIQKAPHLNGEVIEKYFYQDDNFVIVEDLVEEGYQKTQQFDVKHFQSILSTLAKLHTLSLVYGKSIKNYLKPSQNLQLTKSVSNFKKVLSHYEITEQNVVFKGLECRFVNYHPRYFLPPMFDVLGVIFSHTSENFRQHFLQFLVFDYYNNLEKSLNICDIDVNTVLSKNDLHLQIHQVLQLVKSETATLITREECYFVIEKILGSTNYKFKSFYVKPLDQVNGYLGDYHKLVIELDCSNINCFIKCMPKSNSAHGIVHEAGCFYKETFFYQDFVSEMYLFDITNIKDCIPECYYQRFEDVIVFEDISTSFQGYPAQIPFGLSFLKIIAQKLAKFHSSILAFEEKKSKNLNVPFRLNTAYPDLAQEVFFLKDETHHGAKVMQAGIANVPDVINLFPELNQDDFIKIWPKLQDDFYELIKPSANYRNVLCHGDLWTNNIMIKFDDDKTPIDCRFVDFQCTRYCPPVHDLLALIYLTTDRATRAKHTDAVKEIYYDELKKNLAFYGYRVEDLYSLEEFEASYNWLKPQMVVQTILYYSFIMCTSEEISSTLVDDEITKQVFFGDRRDYLKKMCEKSVVFKHRLRESILDLIDLCEKMNTIP